MLKLCPAALVAFLFLLPDVCLSAAPATVAEAVKRLDLTVLPLPSGAVLPGYRREAELSYNLKSSAKEAFDFAHKQLIERGWEQMSGAQNYGDFVSANYTLDGFTVYVSVSPGQPGVVGVMLTHKGNINLEDVPVPTGAQKLHAFPAVVMYKSPDDVATTAAACRKKLLEAGWSPYGDAGDVDYYRQNAQQIDVSVMSAPAQGGATVISITAKLLSLELPAPPFAEDFRYSDGTTAISFDTDGSPQAVADFYRQVLGPLGWKATTKVPVEIRWKKYTIFRNKSQEMITIATHEFEGKTRVHLDHQNAAEVADEEMRSKIAFGEKAKYRDVEWLTVKIDPPSAFDAERIEDWAVKIPVPKEEAFDVAEQVVAKLQSANWSLDEARKKQRPVIREYRLEQGNHVISVLALKHHKLPSWVAVVGIGGVKLSIGE